jgi:hypothetical protein
MEFSLAVTFILIPSLEMSPAHFVWLKATDLIVVSVPLDTAALIFSYNTLCPNLTSILSLPYINSLDVHFPHYSIWNKSFDTLKYYALEIIPHFLNSSPIDCPYCKFTPEKSL